MKKTLVILFLLIFPLSSFSFSQSPDLKVSFSLAENKIPKDKDSVIKAKVSVSNISKKSVLIVVDERIRLSNHTKKRQLSLGLERDYNKYDYKIYQLKLLRPNKSLVIRKSVPTSLFTKMLDGKWQLKSAIGYIKEKDFERLGVTSKTLEKKKSNDRLKISSDFSPHHFAEVQHLEISNEIEIYLNPSNEISFGDKLVQEKVKKKTSEIYDSKSKLYFFITTKSFGEKSTCGTEITAYSKDSKFNRIVSKSCTNQGRMSTEFYFEDEKPIFIYQVFEFFNEKTKNNSWRNFKGLASWESRYYFVGGKLKFHIHKGRNNISEKETSRKPKTEAYEILSFIKSQIIK